MMDGINHYNRIYMNWNGFMIREIRAEKSTALAANTV
jgi:hypothetical protein